MIQNKINENRLGFEYLFKLKCLRAYLNHNFNKNINGEGKKRKETEQLL